MEVVSAARHRPVSVTQEHLLTAISTLLTNGEVQPRNGRLRILDIGCGDGLLIGHLQAGLTAAFPDIAIELHGFDIGEQGYKDEDQLSSAAAALAVQHPGIDWRKRVRIFSDTDSWRYPPGFFDFAVSNQVIEHVRDLPTFLGELQRCLDNDGVSVHLFPLSSCIVEAHCQVPFAHWIHDFDRRQAWIALLSRLGIGAYRRHRRVLGHDSYKKHALETARYIQCWTRYRDFRTIAADCDMAGLSVSGGLTKGLFIAKLRSLCGLQPLRSYRRARFYGVDWLGFAIGRYLSSSTLVIKPVHYDIGRRIAAEKAAVRVHAAA